MVSWASYEVSCRTERKMFQLTSLYLVVLEPAVPQSGSSGVENDASEEKEGACTIGSLVTKGARCLPIPATFSLY